MPKPNEAFPFATTLDFSPLVDFWRDVASDPRNRWHSLAQTVVQRVETVPELNGPLLLLASDAGSLMTGSAVTVDGGHVLSEL